MVDQAPSEQARRIVAASGLRNAIYLTQPRLGLSASRNLALASARGAFLAVTDDDCAPDPAWVGALGSAFARAPQPAAVTGSVLPLGERPPGTFAISLRVAQAPADHQGRALPPWAVGSGGKFAARAEVLRECGGWDERLGTGSPGRAGEDAELLYRLLRRGHVVRYDPAAIVRHEWQTRARRLATRWSYGYGIGAMCGLSLARRDPYGLQMAGAYARMHARPLAVAVRRRDRARVDEHGRALASLAPGILYGLRAHRRPAAQTPLRTP